jgi:outer membrane protein assembly factor BamA
MNASAWGLACAALLAAALLAPVPPARGESEGYLYAYDESGVAWAYGTVVDSISVTGNKNTKTFAIVREMETHTGGVLDSRALRRDIRFLSDLSPFATVTVRADSLSPGHSALRLAVVERSNLFLKSILPFANYNFENGITYGVRWSDKNFRARLEELTFTFKRNQKDDEDVSFSWFAPWVGLHHVSLGGRAAYYNRGDLPGAISVLERSELAASVGLPLTASRIEFSQLQGSLALDKTRNGAIDQPTTNQVSITPTLGYRFDSRDSPLRPTSGQTFLVSAGTTLPLSGGRNAYHRARNQVRIFHSITDRVVLALLSDAVYQFGDFPDYSTVKLGGETLRGYPDSRFSGFHRWFQSAEWRYNYLPRRVFRVPVVHEFDAGLSLIAFVDGGIVWTNRSDFDFNRFHGTTGVGLRFYSPLRDVARLDFGFSATGEARFEFGTGVRF